MLEELRQEIFSTELFEKLRGEVSSLRKDEPLILRGVSGSLLAFIAAAVYDSTAARKNALQIAVIASDAEKSATLRDDLELLLGSGLVRYFSQEVTPHRTSISETVSISQIEALKALAAGESVVAVTHPIALLNKIPSPEIFNESVIEIELKKEVPFDSLLNKLSEFGFEKKDFVEGYGDFAVRGGIVDVFPFVGENPIRLEFWGNTVESIREFDALSQRSIKELQAVQIVPNLLTPQDGAERAGDEFCLLDYLKADAILLLDDLGLIEREIKEVPGGDGTPRFEWKRIQEKIEAFPRIIHSQLSSLESKVRIDFQAASQPSFNGSVDALYGNLRNLNNQGYSIYLLGDTQPLADRLNELIEEIETRPDTEFKPRHPIPTSEVEVSHADAQLSSIHYQLLTETVHHGFILPSARLAVYTEHEIFGRGRRRGDRRRSKFRGFSAREFQSLRRGDYVVHVDFGIGQFVGLEKIKVGKVEQEVVKLSYAENDALYVNLNYLNRIQKYSSKEGYIPKLSRLGSGEWERLKERAKGRIKDIARELITLYASRKYERGFGFSEDTHWQKELEASFIYEDTPDQARATAEVKEDMEKEHPMDRLICGDVGFGKTEVAVRAAFKAIMDGKQMAMLVPTTILAVQHYNTFIDRLSRYSVNVETLSRFRSKKEQMVILEGLQRGNIDIVIGTHRLLSKDVRFRDLGLLIIDEEHRFGVEAKERLRKLRRKVDTLTLTATPIPRTLHFSLISARDLSIMNTPPRNRLPIVTEIAEFDIGLIRNAILKEIHRGGQVYFVHDNVRRINDMCTYLQEHIPEAQFRVAHGQMRSTQLEKVMLDFLKKRFDVLVCTKIIESGLDIPNVNTIIINRADRFGMAEIYQLRGRVGRSNLQAYAFLLVSPISLLPKSTIRRLQALEEFTELGSGFNLAMRDLEIRGTGNLLGAEQSGFITEMGFEMYERILSDSVAELKSQEFQAIFAETSGPKRDSGRETVIDSDLEAYIPDFYVESDTERFDLYRRLARVLSDEEIGKIRDELKDRFGEYPVEVEHLLQLAGLRLITARLGFPRIELKGELLSLYLPDSADGKFFSPGSPQEGQITQLMAKLSRLERLQPELKQDGGILKLTFQFETGGDGLAKIAEVQRILKCLGT